VRECVANACELSTKSTAIVNDVDSRGVNNRSSDGPPHSHSNIDAGCQDGHADRDESLVPVDSERAATAHGPGPRGRPSRGVLEPDRLGPVALDAALK